MDAIFWKLCYNENTTEWDLGEVSPLLREYFNQLTNKSLHILIPCAGRAYEAEYLYKNGFKKVFVAGVVPRTIEDYRDRYPDFPKSNCIRGDFFSIQQKFDVIIEQTFFCALSPHKRQEYAIKAASLLNTTGYLVGLMFQSPLTKDGPPFGGSNEEYLGYFSRMFVIEKLDNCYNSHSTREGKELFIKFRKQ